MNLPEPQSVTFNSLFAEIKNGTIKIPQFQRDFVWSKAKSAKLLDSIVKGYPIGTFILWKTNERLRSIRNLGGVSLPETQKGDAVKYVLDDVSPEFIEKNSYFSASRSFVKAILCIFAHKEPKSFVDKH